MDSKKRKEGRAGPVCVCVCVCVCESVCACVCVHIVRDFRKEYMGQFQEQKNVPGTLGSSNNMQPIKLLFKILILLDCAFHTGLELTLVLPFNHSFLMVLWMK